MTTKIQLGALKTRNFRWYFFGMGISLCGSWLQYIALGWLIYNLNHSATLLGLNSLIGGLPLLLLPPFFGSLIDKLNKRKLLLMTQTLFFIQALILASLTITHYINYQIIMILSLLNGIIFSIDQPLRQVLIPSLIDNKEELPNAIAWGAFMSNVARTLSPALAGLVIFKFGESICFLIDSISFLIMIFVIYQINWNATISTLAKKPFWETWYLGFDYIRNSLLIKQSLFLTLIASSTLGTYTFLMPVITQNIYHSDAKILGYLLTASGIGAIIASLFMTTQSKNIKAIIKKITYSSILSIFALMLLIYIPLFWVGIIAIALLGGSMITTVVCLNTIIQIVAEDAQRGVIMSLFTTVYLGTTPLSNFSASWLTDQVGIISTMSSLALIFFVSIIYFLVHVSAQPTIEIAPLKVE